MGIVERKEREKEARRSQILDAADSVFRTKGYNSATIDDIAKVAELAKGTIYLYYKNKEELHTGLILRAFDMMQESFLERLDEKDTAIEKIFAVGNAYFEFSEHDEFQFALMCSYDAPQRQLISDELFEEVRRKSLGVWQFLITLIDEAKHEGTIKQEIDSFSLALFLWTQSKSIIRLYQRTKLSPGSIMSENAECNFSKMNFPLVYEIAHSFVMSHAVTPEGAKHLKHTRFPSMQELGFGSGEVFTNGRSSMPLDEEIFEVEKI